MSARLLLSTETAKRWENRFFRVLRDEPDYFLTKENEKESGSPRRSDKGIPLLDNPAANCNADLQIPNRVRGNGADLSARAHCRRVIRRQFNRGEHHGVKDRRTEWFVPSFGPLKFRIFIGLLFLPYTGMVLAYAVIGSMLADQIHWDRVGAILVIYFLALGVGAHALDALGSKGDKPWGKVFSKGKLWALAISSIVAAYAIGSYYMVLYTPLLWLIAIPEGFFVFAYNLEWFKRRFHTDVWFAFSWGSLPVLAGYVLQTNRISAAALLVAASMGLLSLVEIKASRPYKEMKRDLAGTREIDRAHIQQFESILKSLSLGVILLGAGMASLRWFG